MLLRTSLAAHEAWVTLLELLRSSGASQEWIWLLEGGSGIFGCNSVVVGLLRRSVALQAAMGASLDWWRFGEYGGEVGMGWRGVWSEVEALEVSD